MKPLSTMQIVLYSAANIGSNLVYALANFAFPLFLSAYSVPNLVVGFLAQERSFVGGFVQPIVGAISDRLPPNRLGRRRPFFLIGVPLTAIALIFLSTYPPLWAVLALLTVFSFFLAVANDPYMAMMADIVPQQQRGRVGGVMAAFAMVGAVASILLSFFFWEQHRTTLFWLVAAALVISYAITFFGIVEPPVPPRSQEKRRGHRIPVGSYLRDMAGRGDLLRYLTATFFFWLGNGGVAPFVTRYGVDVLGTAPNVSFLLVLPAILGAAIFAVPAGILTERFGKKRVLNVGLLTFGSIVLIGGLTVVTIPLGLVMMGLVGIAMAITNALIFPLLTDLMPQERAGEFTGVGQLVWSLAQPIGAVGAGAVADISGTLRGAFAFGGAFMLLAFVIMLTVKTPQSTRAATPAATDAGHSEGSSTFREGNVR